MSASELYFNGSMWGKGGRLNFPIFAIHLGKKDTSAWHSGQLKSGLQFKHRFELLHEKAPLSIVVSEVHAPFFVPRVTSYDALTIDVRKSRKSGGTDMPVASLKLIDPEIIEKVQNGSNFPSLPTEQNIDLDRTWGGRASWNTWQIVIFVKSDSVEIVTL